MKNAEITIPQTNVNLSFAASARDQVVHAIKYITGLDINAPTEDLEGQLKSQQGRIVKRLDMAAPHAGRYFAKSAKSKNLKIDSFGIETTIDRITKHHQVAHGFGIAYGLSCVASVEAFLDILYQNPQDRMQALTNALFTELKRFDCLVTAELEIVRLTNPHIHVNAYNFLISDIRTGTPFITFNPPRSN